MLLRNGEQTPPQAYLARGVSMGVDEPVDSDRPTSATNGRAGSSPMHQRTVQRLFRSLLQRRDPFDAMVRPSRMRMMFLSLVLLSALAACGGDPGGTGGGKTGIRGSAVAGPSCPLESTASPCRPTGVVAHLAVSRVSGSQVLAQTDSAADGHFTLAVPPGRYVVTATLTNGVPSPQTLHRSVTVASQGFVDITMTFDSGIRTPTAGG